MSGRAIGGVSTGHDAFGSRTARDNIIVTTPEEVRRAVQRKKELGCDILKVNEFLSMDLVKVACRRSSSARYARRRAQLGCGRLRQCGR